ncbi:OmpP1/FadL family transporter [Sulfurimonas sp.]|uniref:OmpP1/FadL family transporter n=1 Tax=Sulfurimonas sp. TaxID=2022749 RepID=UPI0039E6AFCD
MKKTIYLSFFCTSLLLGAGYQIPNNSVNSNALATAYVANANGADAAYFNPANMVYNQDKNEIEVSLSYIDLPSMKYTPTSGTTPIHTQQHQTVIPSLHYVSPKLSDNGIRLGLSISVPYGLTREWTDQPAMSTAKKFSLKTIELNPSIAIPITNQFSVAFGVRYVRGEGEVELNALPIYSVNMSGDDDAFAYNIAISYKPTDELNLALTYRSPLTLNTKGSAVVTSPWFSGTTGASLAVEIPDNLILAGAYTFNNATTIEITYDKTFWSKVTETDFNYENTSLEASPLGRITPKVWKDTTVYRLGITHKFKNALTLMCGIAYSNNAADEAYVSYSSPESNSMTYSFGGRYQLNDNLDIGLSLLYADYEDRTSNQGNATGVNGTFSEKDAYSLTSGMRYRF